MGGIVTSATTDGFVCDIPDLEEKIINSPNFKKDSFLARYRNIRKTLSNNPSALEVKTNVQGILQ
ncbi:hypothetical protein HOY80DRAFT_996169 [Tuber brumale]|nr:hypothetical protein HOY80DRAFT_996169 [Tuber brumale]